MGKVRKFNGEISGKYFKYIIIAYVDFEKKQKKLRILEYLLEVMTKKSKSFLCQIRPQEKIKVRGRNILRAGSNVFDFKKILHDYQIIRS